MNRWFNDPRAKAAEAYALAAEEAEKRGHIALARCALGPPFRNGPAVQLEAFGRAVPAVPLEPDPGATVYDDAWRDRMMAQARQMGRSWAAAVLASPLLREAYGLPPDHPMRATPKEGDTIEVEAATVEGGPVNWVPATVLRVEGTKLVAEHIPGRPWQFVLAGDRWRWPPKAGVPLVAPVVRPLPTLALSLHDAQARTHEAGERPRPATWCR